MPFSADIDNEILRHFFGHGTWSAPSNVYVGLSSTAPDKGGANVTEPSGGAYARVQITTASMDTAISSATTNNADLTFAQATADWDSGNSLTHMVLYDAVSGGNFLGSKALTAGKPVLNGDTAKFSTGDFDVEVAGTA